MIPRSKHDPSPRSPSHWPLLFGCGLVNGLGKETLGAASVSREPCCGPVNGGRVSVQYDPNGPQRHHRSLAIASTAKARGERHQHQPRCPQARGNKQPFHGNPRSEDCLPIDSPLGPWQDIAVRHVRASVDPSETDPPWISHCFSFVCLRDIRVTAVWPWLSAAICSLTPCLLSFV